MSEVRVAVLLPHENAMISPGLGDPMLFRHDNPENRPAIAIAQRVVSERTLALPPMSLLHHLESVDGVAGYSMRPATGHEINFRNFTVRRFDIDHLLESGEALDPTDFALLSMAHSLARQWAGNVPALRS